MNGTYEVRRDLVTAVLLGGSAWGKEAVMQYSIDYYGYSKARAHKDKKMRLGLTVTGPELAEVWRTAADKVRNRTGFLYGLCSFVLSAIAYSSEELSEEDRTELRTRSTADPRPPLSSNLYDTIQRIVCPLWRNWRSDRNERIDDPEEDIWPEDWNSDFLVKTWAGWMMTHPEAIAPRK